MLHQQRDQREIQSGLFRRRALEAICLVSFSSPEESDAHAQPARRSQGLRTSPNQPANFRVNEEATREQMRTPCQLGPLVASRLEGPIPENDGQRMSPMGSDEPPTLPFQL